MDFDKKLRPKKYRKILENKSKKILPNKDSPKRVEIGPINFIRSQKFSGKFKVMKTMMKQGRRALFSARKSYSSLNSIPKSPKTRIAVNELVELESFVHSLGADLIGYTNLNPENIFQNQTVLFPNVIVIVREMDRELIEKAPSLDTQKMILHTYYELNVIALKLAKYLNNQGFGAQSCSSLGGDVLLVPLGEKAGLGYHGRHGLLITPEFGPRMRLNAVFTSIENLPFSVKNEHDWIPNYCKKCGICIKTCPGKAIKDQPIIHNQTHLTHIDNSKCFPVFYKDHGCSICIKTCAFNQNKYESLFKTLG